MSDFDDFVNICAYTLGIGLVLLSVGMVLYLWLIA